MRDRSKVQTLQAQRCVLRKFNVMEDQNVHDQIQVTKVFNAHGQIASYALRSFFDEIQIQTNPGYIRAAHA